jgi:hypothetical protein
MKSRSLLAIVESPQSVWRSPSDRHAAHHGAAPIDGRENFPTARARHFAWYCSSVTFSSLPLDRTRL